MAIPCWTKFLGLQEVPISVFSNIWLIDKCADLKFLQGLIMTDDWEKGIKKDIKVPKDHYRSNKE